MAFQITVRFGPTGHRYHTMQVQCDDVRQALRQVADEIPESVAAHADLVELRPFVDPDARTYLGEDE